MMDDDPTQCGRCFQGRATNPALKLMISICGHSCCDNCVSTLFTKVAVQKCPKCGKAVVREDYSDDAEDSSAVENEIRVRERLGKTFNKQRFDFPAGQDGLRTFNDYLEMVEDIIYDLVYGTKDQKEKAQERIQKYEQGNRKVIDKNRQMLEQKMTEQEQAVRQEEEEFEQRKQQYIQEEQERLRDELLRRQNAVKEMETSTKKRKSSGSASKRGKRRKSGNDMDVEEEAADVNVVDDEVGASGSSRRAGGTFSYFPSGPPTRHAQGITGAVAQGGPVGQPKPKGASDAMAEESKPMSSRQAFAAAGHSTAFEKMRAMQAARECLCDHRFGVSA